MKLENIFYTINDEQLFELFNVRTLGNFMIGFKKLMKQLLTFMLDDPESYFEIFNYTEEEYSNLINHIYYNIDDLVQYLYEYNSIEEFFAILPKKGSNTALNTTAHYRQLFYTDNMSYLGLLHEVGGLLEKDIDNYYYVKGIKILGSGTFGTGILIESTGNVLKISSDEEEHEKDRLFKDVQDIGTYDKLMEHFPKIYDFGRISNFSYMLPTTQNIIQHPYYSVKEYIEHNKTHGSILNQLFTSQEYKMWDRSLVEFGKEHGIKEWDIHQDNLSLVDDDRVFVYFDY